ncbi:hypothetical protein C3L33_04388, partial [Rhododendron williamsianum]
MCDGENRRDVPSLELSSLKIISALGRGAKGVVFLAQINDDQSSDNEFFALKAFRELRLRRRRTRLAATATLRGVVATDQIVGYAIDYCPGRDLNSLRKKQTEKMFSDDVIRFYAAELVLALEYLHGLGIVYRDLKPENVMVQESGHLMLVDFDLSTKLSVKSPQTVSITKSTPNSVQLKKTKSRRRRRRRRESFRPCFFATPGFCRSTRHLRRNPPSTRRAPSPTRWRSRTRSWDGGVRGARDHIRPRPRLRRRLVVPGSRLYEMLYGATPFRGSNRKETFYRVLTKAPELVGEPTPLRDLIGKLLEKDPKQRIQPEGIKGHGFFRGVDWGTVVEITRPPYIPPVGPEEEELRGEEGIDVEAFVRGVFKIAKEESGNGEESESKRNHQEEEEKKISSCNNGGVWVEGLDHPSGTDNFLVF